MTAVFKKRRTLISTLFAITIILLTEQVSFGQENDDNQATYKGNESFLKLPDGVVKREIAFFNIKASTSPESFPKIKVNEIFLKKCTDSFAFFEKGNIYASEIIVSIQSENIAIISRIKEVFYIHYKYGFFLPDSAINDIYDPIFCHNYTKRNKPIASDCKVFQSEDERRIYIYMLNGHGEGSYEVTWVIQDNKYYTRVIDPITRAHL
ncbi:MAG: hypothetical protein KAT48_14325 [Bacteroidales bacterium]|nr:hypothetical protein [Bacteroidales bacterium]